MPAPDIHAGLPYPLTRFNTLFPGQYGVPYTDAETGLRTDPVGTVFYVDPNHTDPNDSRDGTDPNAPLQTVQAGIDRCEHYHNDVVHVGPNNISGTVHNLPVAENVTLNKAGVRLVGCTMGARGVYWRPASGTALTVTAPDCIIEGFYFLADTGITLLYDNAQAAWAYNETVRHCYFVNCDVGIRLTDSHYGLIHGNWFDVCAFGIFSSYAQGDNPWDYQIFNNFFDVCARAIFMRNAAYCNIYRNRIMESRTIPATAVDSVICLRDGGRNIISENVLPCNNVGGYNATCTSGANDVWTQNYCYNGIAYGPPA